MLSQDSLRRVGFVWRAIQVRLRFVVLLVCVFLLIGQWDRVRNYWDLAWSRFSGQASKSQSVSADVEFFCPMDPGVISDWPSICPVCNMALVKRKKGEMAVLPEGVVARMQFSPYRVQLAGIQTLNVRQKALVYTVQAAGELQATPDDRPQKLPLRITIAPRFGSLKWIGKTARVVSRDVPGIEPLTGIVQAQSNSTLILEVNNPDDLLQPGNWATAQFELPFGEVEPFRSAKPKSKRDTILTVPESAVVDFGSRKLVYVETEPGMFDGREVVLGPRSDEEYPVLNGLVAGQKVAVTGAFLIDAEARLNPNLASGYFGAAQRASPAPAPSPSASPTVTPDSAQAKQSIKATEIKLSKADIVLVRKQRNCPVTGLPLDSMGGPMPVVVQGRRVFICCEGCESRLKKEPGKFLAKLPRP
jgi:Cu(I)/Ag(I) efflux system membrane fusion protein